MNHDDLEHESGLRPLGEYPDHCPRCARVATCEHEERTEVATLGRGVVTALCAACGTSLPLAREEWKPDPFDPFDPLSGMS